MEKNYDRSNRMSAIAILEMVVSGIVVLGGAALVYYSVDIAGKALGIIHAILGLIGISAGFLLWMKSGKAWTVTVWANVMIISFSIASEIVLSALNSLPSDQFVDSVIGTIVAVLISTTVIAMLAKPDLKKFLGKS